MITEVVRDIEDWKSIRGDWDRLAEHNPMMCFDWMYGWWQAYGAGSRLHIVLVRNSSGAIVGIAPLYEKSPSGAAVLCFLASGSVCSDYLEVMADSHCRFDVIRTVAEHAKLQFGQFGSNTFARGVWLESLDDDSPSTRNLVREMNKCGFLVRSKPTENCWCVDLPETWETFLMQLNCLRRKARKAISRIESGQIHVHETTRSPEASKGLGILKSLHLKRRFTLGDAGCYTDPRFERFLENAIPPMLDAGKAKVVWLETGEQPVSVLLMLVGKSCICQYQSGFDPAAKEFEPGHASVAHGIRSAIAAGFARYDFLRGDEPYKKSWSAAPTRIVKTWFVPPTICARTAFFAREKAIALRNAYRSVVASRQMCAVAQCDAEPAPSGQA